MPKETINWKTTRALPPVDKLNVLSPVSALAKENPSAARRPFHPVIFQTEEGDVVPGRYFNTNKLGGMRWWSIQGRGFFNSEVKYWAEIPKGPRTTGYAGPR